MSALPVSEPVRRQTSIKAACFTPTSYFKENGPLSLEPAKLYCFNLILVETLGAHPARTFAEIPIEMFVAAAVVSREVISNSLNFLESSGFIRRTYTLSGKPQYAIREEYIREVKAAGREKLRGKCPDCQTVGTFSTEFVPVPHLVFRKLGACLKPAAFKATMVIIGHTSQWSRENRCYESEPTELELSEFTKVCDLEKREVINGLNEAIKLGIVGRQQRAGKPSLFWLIPEGIAALERRPFRVVSPSYGGGNEKAKQDTSKTSESPKESAKPSANETGSKYYGRCDSCGHFVDIEPVTEAEFADSPRNGPEKKPVERARADRAGPTEQPRSTFPVWEGLDKLKHG